MRIAKKRDPELCRSMELLHKHSVKPNSKLLTAKTSDIKAMYTLWFETRVRDEIYYRTGKEVDDEWQLVMPREKCTEILSLLHDSRTAGHPGMSRMKLTGGSRFYWPRL